MDDTVTLSILQQYYANVKHLRTYLQESLYASNSSQPPNLVTDHDDEPFHRLLETTYVATQVPQIAIENAIPWSSSPRVGMQEVCTWIPCWNNSIIYGMKGHWKISRTTSIPKDTNPRYYSRILTCSEWPFMRANPIIAHFWQKDGSRESIARRLHNTFVNTIVTALQEPQWTSLLQRYAALVLALILLTRSN